MGRQATWSRHPVHADSEVKGKVPPKAKTKGGASGAVSSNVEPAQPAKAKGNDKGKAKATSESCSVAAQPLACCLAAQPLQWQIDGRCRVLENVVQHYIYMQTRFLFWDSGGQKMKIPRP